MHLLLSLPPRYSIPKMLTREAGETRHILIYQINVYEQFEVLRTITSKDNHIHITALAHCGTAYFCKGVLVKIVVNKLLQYAYL